MLQGRFALTVDSGVLTFCNHGCNSTCNIALPLSQNEFEIDLSLPPPPDFFDEQHAVYDPLFERTLPFESSTRRGSSHQQIMCSDTMWACHNILRYHGRCSFLLYSNSSRVDVDLPQVALLVILLDGMLYSTTRR